MQMLTKEAREKKERIDNHGTIYKTYNYDLFQLMTGNRELNQRNLAKIEASSIQKQLIIPIQVNENYEIVDGQHRFHAWRKLSMPIYFIVNEGYGLDEVELANNSGVLWKSEDFLNKFVIQKRPEYIVIDDYLNKYKLNITDLMKLLSHYQVQSEKHIMTQFMQGKISLDGLEHVQIFLDTLEQFSFFPFYKNKAFVRAYFKFYTHERFNLDRMMKQIEVRRGQFIKYNTIDEYLCMLANEVYSFGLGKNLIHYDKQTQKFY
jgi:ParB-like nuclease family protein